MKRIFLLLILLLRGACSYAFLPDTLIEKNGTIHVGTILMKNNKPYVLISPSENYKIKQGDILRIVIETEDTIPNKKKKIIFFPNSRSFYLPKIQNLNFTFLVRLQHFSLLHIILYERLGREEEELYTS